MIKIGDMYYYTGLCSVKPGHWMFLLNNIIKIIDINEYFYNAKEQGGEIVYINKDNIDTNRKYIPLTKYLKRLREKYGKKTN